jgi:multiple antibiotic resistance protein
MHFWAIVFSLFVVLNAIGNIPLFIGLLNTYDVSKQKRIIAREMGIALLILLLFNFFGDDILEFLGISGPIIGMAGGALLFIIGLGMIFPKEDKQKAPAHEPFIVPLAMPVIAGPGAITAVMIYSEQLQNSLMLSGAILCAWIPSAALLLAASYVKYVLGEKGLHACSKFGGMLMCLIAVRMFANGALDYVKNAFHLS